MAGLSICDLPWPTRRYRVDRQDPAFETEVAAGREDALRTRLLRSQASKHSGNWGVQARQLADRLDPALNHDFPESPASSRYMRYHRICIIGGLLRLVSENDAGATVRFDIVKPSLARDLEGLLDESPRRAGQELRADLIRVGTRPENGFLFAGYHNESDPTTQLFQGHHHILATGGYVDLLNGLRGLKGYRPTSSVRTPIRATHTLTNPAHALTYLLKSYWPQRPSLPLGANGSPKRPRKGQRIDEPYHSQVLLWLDQWTLSDLTLLMGMRVGQQGLIIT